MSSLKALGVGITELWLPLEVQLQEGGAWAVFQKNHVWLLLSRDLP